MADNGRRVQPRSRVIVDNDFSGDPDDLFQLAHHVLSPSVEIPLVIGSHLSPGDYSDLSDHQADNAARIARELLDLMQHPLPVVAGSNLALRAIDEPIESAAALAIIEEAMRDDTQLPLYVALGAGMTDLASAVLIEPRIAERIRAAIWIGGPEHPGIGLDFPEDDSVEYNLAIDIPAVQAVFNSSRIALWQVPRNTYRQANVSFAELDARVAPHGPLGGRLADSIASVHAFTQSHGLLLGETYGLGDQALVLLTALQAAHQPDTASSSFVARPTPIVTTDGWYSPNPGGRPMRIYTQLDTRLMFEDMFLKFAAFARA